MHDNTKRSEAQKESSQKFVDKQQRSWWVEGKNPFAAYKFAHELKVINEFDVSH
jgi:hypothetical protein